MEMSYKFSFTPAIIRSLQTIERVKETVRLTILPPAIAETLRFNADIRSTHFSTAIEGNRLTLAETEMVVRQGQQFPGRERDVQEVARYYQALQQMENWVEGKQRITEERIRKLHAILYSGRRTAPTPYRDAQNVIRDGKGNIVYMPPEAADVPAFMSELVPWVNATWDELPIPVVAGVAHYQFETIHPFFDGNGRTGRMLTTWILHAGGYDLGKFYSLEEFYAQDLNSYHAALVTHPHHNYYFGRNEADFTSWLEYFLRGMAVVFERVAAEVRSKMAGEEMDQEQVDLLRSLDHRARKVINLFVSQEFVQSSEAASLLGISPRQARDLMAGWVKDGWLEIADPSRRGRKFKLKEEFEILIRK